MTNQLTRGKAKIGGLVSRGYNARALSVIEFTLTRDSFQGTAGAVGTAAAIAVIPAQATFDHMALTGGTGFLGNGSALISFGDGSDVDRYHGSGSVNIFGTAANGYSMGDPSGTKYHASPGTVTAQLRGTSAIGSVTAGTVNGYMAFWF